jgi:hypothetical protein
MRARPSRRADDGSRSVCRGDACAVRARARCDAPAHGAAVITSAVGARDRAGGARTSSRRTAAGRADDRQQEQPAGPTPAGPTRCCRQDTDRPPAPGERRPVEVTSDSGSGSETRPVACARDGNAPTRSHDDASSDRASAGDRQRPWSRSSQRQDPAAGEAKERPRAAVRRRVVPGVRTGRRAGCRTGRRGRRRQRQREGQGPRQAGRRLSRLCEDTAGAASHTETWSSWYRADRLGCLAAATAAAAEADPRPRSEARAARRLACAPGAPERARAT